MITPIYRICTACRGEGAIESLQWPQSGTVGTSKTNTIGCVSCRGVGYVPTGDFLIEQMTEHFSHELEKLPEYLRKTIIRSGL